MAFARTKIAYRRNLTLAKRLWSGQINREQQLSLRSLSANYGLSIAAGDLQLLDESLVCDAFRPPAPCCLGGLSRNQHDDFRKSS